MSGPLQYADMELLSLLGFSFSRYLLLVLIAQGTLQYTDLEDSCLSFQAPSVSQEHCVLDVFDLDVIPE